MTEIEQQIYDDLSTAGWNLFTDKLAKIEVAQHLARKGYRRPEGLIPLTLTGHCVGGLMAMQPHLTSVCCRVAQLLKSL